MDPFALIEPAADRVEALYDAAFKHGHRSLEEAYNARYDDAISAVRLLAVTADTCATEIDAIRVQVPDEHHLVGDTLRQAAQFCRVANERAREAVSRFDQRQDPEDMRVVAEECEGHMGLARRRTGEALERVDGQRWDERKYGAAARAGTG